MNDSFYQRLARLRIERGMSQEQLSAELGVSRQAISKWERGESTPDTNNLIALADIYDLTLDELVRGETLIQPVDSEPDREQPEGELESGAEQGAETLEAELAAPEPGSDAEPESDPELVSEPESEPAQPEPEPEPEPGPEPETMVLLEPGPEPEEDPFDSSSLEEALREEGGVRSWAFGKDYVLYPTACFAAFMFLGICFNRWHPGWVILLLPAVMFAVKKPLEEGRPLGVGSYAVLVTFVYLFIGAFMGLWHPGWLLFLSIPFYAWWKAQGNAPRTSEDVMALVAAMVVLVMLMAGLNRITAALSNPFGLFG